MSSSFEDPRSSVDGLEATPAAIRRLTPDAKGFIARKMAKNRAGDWRDEADVKRWVESVVAELVAPGPAQQRRPQSNR